MKVSDFSSQYSWRKSQKSVIWTILLKRNLETLARISLYNQLQTYADSERIPRLSWNFQRMLLHGHLQFLWKAIRSELCNFNSSKTTFFTKKYKTLLILCFNNILTTSVENCIRIAAMIFVLSRFIQPYPHQKPVNFRKLWLLENRYFTPPVNKTGFILNPCDTCFKPNLSSNNYLTSLLIANLKMFYLSQNFGKNANFGIF